MDTDLAFKLLLFVHLVALVVGASANVVSPVISRQVAAAQPDARAGLMAISKTLRFNGQIAIAVLVLSGVAMMWVRYGGVAWAGPWFWVKMALVAAIVGLLLVGATMQRLPFSPRVFGAVNRVILLGIVFAAVLAFN